MIIDEKLPGIDGVQLLERLKTDGQLLPAIMITGHGDAGTAVCAMKAGAADFIEKPISPEELLASVERIFRQFENAQEHAAWQVTQAQRMASLTQRQREIMDLIVAGHANKEIAARLGINQRTVESHRAIIMKKTDAKSLPDLVRIALACGR